MRMCMEMREGESVQDFAGPLLLTCCFTALCCKYPCRKMCWLANVGMRFPCHVCLRLIVIWETDVVCFGVKTCHLGHASCLHFGTLGEHPGIKGHLGAQERAPEVQPLLFIDFGATRGPNFVTFWALFTIVFSCLSPSRFLDVSIRIRIWTPGGPKTRMSLQMYCKTRFFADVGILDFSGFGRGLKFDDF